MTGFPVAAAVLLLAQDDGGAGYDPNAQYSPPGQGQTEMQADPGLGPVDGSGSGSPPPGRGFDPTFLFLMVGVVVIFIFMSTRAGSRERKQRAAMLAGLSRGDRVQTVGGVIGAVEGSKDDEIILRIDAGTSTRLRFARSAVQQVLKSSRDTESKPPAEPQLQSSGK